MISMMLVLCLHRCLWGWDSSTDEGTTEGTNSIMTSTPDHDSTSEGHLPINGGFHLNVKDFDKVSTSQSSFLSIHFGRLTLLVVKRIGMIFHHYLRHCMASWHHSHSSQWSLSQRGRGGLWSQCHLQCRGQYPDGSCCPTLGLTLVCLYGFTQLFDSRNLLSIKC